jgi:hypothetical protein
MKNILFILVVLCCNNLIGQNAFWDFNYFGTNPSQCNPFLTGSFSEPWKVSHGSPNLHDVFNQGTYNYARFEANYNSVNFTEESEGLFINYSFQENHVYDMKITVMNISGTDVNMKLYAANSVAELSSNCVLGGIPNISSKEVILSSTITSSLPVVINLSSWSPDNNYNFMWLVSFSQFSSLGVFGISEIRVFDLGEGSSSGGCDLPSVISLSSNIGTSGLRHVKEAQEEIRLENGFKYKPHHVGNSYFKARIVPCLAGKVSLNKQLPSENLLEKVARSGDEYHNFNSKIYPNPNNGHFSITIESDETTLIEVYDLMGKQIFSENTNEVKRKIDITNQPKGIYLVKVTVGNEVFTEKVIYQ